MSESPESQGSVAYVFVLAVVATIGGFLFGFDSGVINGTQEGLQAAFGGGSATVGFNVASILLGCAVGAFFAGPLADQFGRRPIMLVASVFFMVSALGAGWSNDTVEFVIYRLVGGLAVGAASVIAPAYISEIAPAHLRGRLGSLQQLAIVIGLFSAAVSNYLIALAAGSADADFWLGFQAWRWMFWMEAVPAVAFFIGASLIPESPRYLVAANKEHKAAKVFARTVGGDVQALIKRVRATLAANRKPRLSDLLTEGTRRLRPIVWVGIFLSVFQQFVGINVVFYYSSEVWEAAGFSEENAMWNTVINNSINIGGTIIAIALVDRVGRKLLLLTGSIGMAVSLGSVMLAFNTGTLVAANGGHHLQLSSTAGLAALIAMNTFVFFFAVSWGPVVWVLLGEMFSNEIRGAALALGAAAQWVANFAISMTFPVFLTSIGLAGSYGIYTVCAGLSFFFVLFFVRETKGKQLEEM